MTHKKLSLFSLILLIVTAIDSIRNLPASALFGSALIFFFIFSAIIFLMPTALVAAELSATFPQKGGIYYWVSMAFGKKWAMLAIWLQWISTMVWYPSLLSFIAGTAAYLINPALAQNKIYLVSFILVCFWSITLINLRGIYVSAQVNKICGLLGTIFPMIFLIILGVIWVLKGNPLQIELQAGSLFPSLSKSTNWVSLIAIISSFIGMELSGVHVNDIHNPQRNFPKAVGIASLFILFSMMFGALTIALVLPERDISLISGVMQVFRNLFYTFKIPYLIPVLTVCIVFGSIAGMINWLLAPAKGFLHASEFGYLPPFFTRTNRSGAASHILITQGVLVTLFCLLFLFVPSVNACYWFLTALSTELYVIMYLLMFCTALRLHYKYTDRPKVFKIPGGQFGIWGVCLLGLFACITTIIVSFFPHESLHIDSSSTYIFMICLGTLVTISPVFLFFLYKRKHP